MSKENTEKRKEYHKDYREAENLAQIFFCLFSGIALHKMGGKSLDF